MDEIGRTIGCVAVILMMAAAPVKAPVKVAARVAWDIDAADVMRGQKRAQTVRRGVSSALAGACIDNQQDLHGFGRA